ncbi:hypothetical protein F2Q68_00034678 [Brassica cretica]|uniref:Uncharacterized protein n=1 Tax=Brassica cretica TaxID=69181 RepID=A0A8S9H5U7_BRACR|nr:hypothetical protein F2Q68_00034678 [Brassica cretica]
MRKGRLPNENENRPLHTREEITVANFNTEQRTPRSTHNCIRETKRREHQSKEEKATESLMEEVIRCLSQAVYVFIESSLGIETLVRQIHVLTVFRSVNNEMSATTHDFAVALSRVSLVSPPPFYMTRSPSFKTTTIVPQAVVTSFTFQLEKASSFSWRTFRVQPATAPGPRRLFCFIHVDLFPLDMFPDPDGLRLT